MPDNPLHLLAFMVGAFTFSMFVMAIESISRYFLGDGFWGLLILALLAFSTLLIPRWRRYLFEKV